MMKKACNEIIEITTENMENSFLKKFKNSKNYKNEKKS